MTGGKNILITGANRGIGFEIARQTCKRGFHVFISGREDKKVSEALARLKTESVSAEMILMDVSKDDTVKAAAESLAVRNIRLDVIINNAGISLREDKSIKDGEFRILNTIINTNCYGVLRVVKAFLPLMNRPGRIINISSEGGSMTERVGGWSPAYCVSKSMLNALTRHLAFELSGNGISVNAVTPGWVRTDIGGRYALRSVEKGAETPVWLASDAPQNLTGRFFKDKHEIEW